MLPIDIRNLSSVTYYIFLLKSTPVTMTIILPGRKLFFKISQNLQKTSVAESLYN